ncbi:S26 family signal peptidase [Embleya scabrispora]|uniref:S26 family signal peptidase n=1 Tax=Embleya scabrispora TaxID=159449 RepID=UPI00036FD32D|nr:S26 family signal peptidase [Embleya scabrispora]MYS85311.1 S26 family signal peptidase [Streptomyces sp. SID5474]
MTAATPRLLALTGLLVLGTALLSARERLVAVTVRGYSMSPTLMPGDRVLMLRGRRRAATGRLAVVVAPHPEYGWNPPAGATPDSWYVKRIAAVAGEPVPDWAGRCPGTHVPPDMLVLLGERPGSMDSKQWGYCPEDKLVGTILLRLRAAVAAGGASANPDTRSFSDTAGPDVRASWRSDGV